MLTKRCLLLLALSLSCPLVASAEEILFEDNFENGLSPKWQVMGLNKEEYRIRDGALELLVQPAKFGRHTPMLKVMLPFTTNDTVTAAVEVTILDKFTQPKEYAALYLIDEEGREFGAKQQWIDERLVYAPGNYIFQGEPGEEGDSSKYAIKYTEVEKTDGSLRIIARQNNAFFQVGPTARKGKKYLNFFYSAVNREPKERGFALIAGGGSDEEEHWVRFDNFKVTK